MSLPSYVINWEELSVLLDDLSDGLVARGVKDVDGIQKIKGFAQSVPAVQANFEIVEWDIPHNIVITGITFNQSSWKGEDYWELFIDNELILETVYTKELGEQKHWEVVHPIQAGKKIKVILNNNSGNSRDTWVDIEYLEVGEAEIVE